MHGVVGMRIPSVYKTVHTRLCLEVVHPSFLVGQPEFQLQVCMTFYQIPSKNSFFHRIKGKLPINSNFLQYFKSSLFSNGINQESSARV